MKTSASFVVFLKAFLLEILPSSSFVNQQSDFISANKGDSVSLPCFYEVHDLIWVSWYKQTLKQKLQLVSRFYRYSKESRFYHEFNANPRFSLNTENKNFQLKILDLQYSDSATYFCVANLELDIVFKEAFTVYLKNSGLTIQTSVSQSSSENIHAGDSVTLNCTVHTGSCDGGHRFYWFKDSEDSHPGLIYTHGGRNDQCERNSDAQTHTCNYELPINNLTEFHAGIYYCAVAACGHILFGNRTKLDLNGQPRSWLVIFLSGSLTFMSVLVVFLVYMVKKQNCSQSKDESSAVACTPEAEKKGKESLHYAAINVKRSNRSRRQKNDVKTDCVYATVRQQN